MLRIYFHLFAGISLVGMSLWIIKDLWFIILLVLIPVCFIQMKNKGLK